MTPVAVGMGGNLPQTLGALGRARVFLSHLLESARFSSLYRTLPLLDTQQDPFWNAVAVGGWAGSAEALLERLLMFEAGEGRLRDPLRPKGPRILDLDLLYAGTRTENSPRLTVPHPGLAQREFVLRPLVELEPLGIHPTSGLRWSLLLSRLSPQGVDRTDRRW